MPMKAPSEPTKRSQPRRTAASTATLTGAVPSTFSRYALSCSSNSSKQGTETTRVGVPFSCSMSRASSAISTSEPLAKIATFASPPVGGGKLVGALCREVLRDVFGAHRAQVLPGQHQRRRRLGRVERRLPAFRGLDRVGRPEDQMVGDRAHGGEMLDRLVRRAVLAEPDRIVGHDEERADAHQRGQPHRRPRIVGEAEEGAAIGDQPAMQRDAVERGGHAVLADAVMNVAAGIVARPTAP